MRYLKKIDHSSTGFPYHYGYAIVPNSGGYLSFSHAFKIFHEFLSVIGELNHSICCSVMVRAGSRDSQLCKKPGVFMSLIPFLLKLIQRDYS